MVEGATLEAGGVGIVLASGMLMPGFMVVVGLWWVVGVALSFRFDCW